MDITREGNAQKIMLRGECGRCRCRVALNQESESDRNLVHRDNDGVAVVDCPTKNCGHVIVVQILREV